MTILAIVPGKTKMCLQENLVDCADCGGLSPYFPHRSRNNHILAQNNDIPLNKKITFQKKEGELQHKGR